MKKLSEVLEAKSARDGFPMVGVNGYAGEQDGTTVILGGFEVMSRKEAESVIIPDKAELHWATYTPGRGWTGAIGLWSNQTSENDKSVGIYWL